MNSTIDFGALGRQSLLSTLLIGVGALTLASVVFTIARVLLSTFILPGRSLSSFGPKGSWAVITGASDGIGKEYALQLAKKGFNLVLVSRTASKLESLSSQIKTSSPSVSVETLAMDFSQNLDKDYAALGSLLREKKVAILINNVGQSHSIPVAFAETPLSEMTNIININCLGTLRATQTVLPSMLPQKKGLILTMGSFGGLTPTPLLATYSGSKAFLQHWSNAIASELAPSGIEVFFVHSYLVTSSMSKIRRANWQVPTEKAFVKSTLAKIGRRGGSVGYPYSGSPYWSHALVAALVTGVVGPMNSLLLGYNRSMHVAIRRRALRKAERDAQKSK
ncbi:beta-keto reductase [Cladophialophora yegresii CBS 114405]|uniref:Very-long-chain 3-oxoacyl-CoA reductase n=1 Tax=Cladophialophora yegresii CBS 114405 TaxID=1182544 RepID=W9VQW5_9EURO|nr:beta-keto reductase [Cladophialophora yegresii CBS 114405]EXJ57938.1 beta-keto reductase [Cladophialophora yegresii CBS 114405]